VKASLKTASKYFKYAVILFLMSYTIYIIIDDFVFIKELSGFADFIEFLEIQFGWFVAYFLGFSFYYWLTALIVIFVYHKLRKTT